MVKCPVCGKSSWRQVVRREKTDPAKGVVTVMYRVCTKCNFEEKV